MEAIRKLGKTVVTVLWDAAYSGMTHDAPVNNLMLISGRLLNSCLTMLQMKKAFSSGGNGEGESES